jgi:hypothetical protein
MNTTPYDDIPTLRQEKKPHDEQSNVRRALEQGTATDPTGKGKEDKKAKASKKSKDKVGAATIYRLSPSD